jgi:hypothetical protein
MTDTPKPNLIGDATSQLVQIHVRDIGLKNFKFSGDGSQDIRRLVCEAFNSHLVSNALWEMCRVFSKACDDMEGKIPEEFKAIVSAGILHARSDIDLGRKV